MRVILKPYLYDNMFLVKYNIVDIMERMYLDIIIRFIFPFEDFPSDNYKYLSHRYSLSEVENFPYITNPVYTMIERLNFYVKAQDELQMQVIHNDGLGYFRFKDKYM